MILFWCKSKGKAAYVIGVTIVAGQQQKLHPTKGLVNIMIPVLHYAAVCGGEYLFGPAFDFIPMLTDEQKADLLNAEPPLEALKKAIEDAPKNGPETETMPSEPEEDSDAKDPA
jgi:hypothetical protein